MKTAIKSRKRIFWLVALFSASCLTTSLFAILFLYNVGVDNTKSRLIEIVESQASLMESVARINIEHGRLLNHSSAEVEQLTISEFRDAHSKFSGMGHSGEFTLGRRQNNKIHFLLSHRHHDLNNLQPIAWEVDLAEPMRAALEGKSGIMVGLDYRGSEVLAAFRPIHTLNLGIVAKIDLAEVRQSYVEAGIILMLISLIVVAVGSSLFFYITEPILTRLVERTLELEEVISTKNRFFSIISHDLKGPIGAIVGLSGFLLNRTDKLSKEQILSNLKNIRKSSVNTYQLIEQLLDWARCQSNQMVSAPRWFDVSILIKEIVDFETEFAGQKVVSLPEVPSENIQVFADREMLSTVLRNLLSNSIKYSHSGGGVFIEFGFQGQTLEKIEIHDQGTGISQKIQDRLFLIEEASSMPGTQGEPGTGLGLILCKELMGKMGGTIRYQDSHHGGCCFVLSLPATP